MSFHTIRQTVAIGNRLASDDLPTTDAAVDRGIATYPSSAQGGLFVFGQRGETVPPSDGDTYVVHNRGVSKVVRIEGHTGDAATLTPYIGRPGSLRALEPIPVSGDLMAFVDWELLADEVIGFADAGGGVLEPRVLTVTIDAFDGGRAQ